MMKKLIAFGIVIAGIAVAFYLYMVAKAPILGAYTPSEQLGEIEFKPNGKAYFKKLGFEGDVRADGEQVSVATGGATFFFTKTKDGKLVEGVMNPSKKILPPPPEPPKEVKDQMEKWKRLAKEHICPFCDQKIPAGKKLNYEPWGMMVPPPQQMMQQGVPPQGMMPPQGMNHPPNMPPQGMEMPPGMPTNMPSPPMPETQTKTAPQKK
jgi:hypothetical protein